MTRLGLVFCLDAVVALTRRQIAPRSLVQGWRPAKAGRRSTSIRSFPRESCFASNLFDSPNTSHLLKQKMTRLGHFLF